MQGDDVTAACPPTDRAPVGGSPSAERVTFRVARQTFGLPLQHVGRVLRMVAVSPVPEVAPYVMGAIDLHGHVVAVVDMRARLGHPVRPPVVDEALHVLTSGPAELQTPHATMKDKPLLQATLLH